MSEYLVSPYRVLPGGAGSDYLWVHEATHGGKGSHNFGDSSKSGARGQRAIATPNSGFGPHALIAGGGGGARPTPLLKFGSVSPGYSPGGVVVVRIFKVVDP